MIRICVLGSIGSGKSFISKLFNCPIFNADREVNHVYRNDRKCFNQLKNKLSSYIKSFPIKKKELIKAINSKKRKNYNKKINKTLNQNQAAMLKKRKLAHYIVDNNSPPDIMRKKIKLLKKRIFDERNRT